MPCARASTKGLPFQLAMAICNAMRDDSASSFRATPPVPSRPGICSALALGGLALGHKPHAQRRPSLDQMDVPRLHLPMTPRIHSSLHVGVCLLGATHIDLSSTLTPVQTTWPAVDRTTRTKSQRQKTTLLVMQHSSTLHAVSADCKVKVKDNGYQLLNGNI